MFSSPTSITISFGLWPPPPTPSPPSQHTGKKSSNLSDWQIWVPTAPICSTFGYGWNVQQSSRHYNLFWPLSSPSYSLAPFSAHWCKKNVVKLVWFPKIVCLLVWFGHLQEKINEHPEGCNFMSLAFLVILLPGCSSRLRWSVQFLCTRSRSAVMWP